MYKFWKIITSLKRTVENQQKTLNKQLTNGAAAVEAPKFSTDNGAIVVSNVEVVSVNAQHNAKNNMSTPVLLNIETSESLILNNNGSGCGMQQNGKFLLFYLESIYYYEVMECH